METPAERGATPITVALMESISRMHRQLDQAFSGGSLRLPLQKLFLWELEQYCVSRYNRLYMANGPDSMKFVAAGKIYGQFSLMSIILVLQPPLQPIQEPGDFGFSERILSYYKCASWVRGTNLEYSPESRLSFEYYDNKSNGDQSIMDFIDDDDVRKATEYLISNFHGVAFRSIVVERVDDDCKTTTKGILKFNEEDPNIPFKDILGGNPSRTQNMIYVDFIKARDNTIMCPIPIGRVIQETMLDMCPKIQVSAVTFRGIIMGFLIMQMFEEVPPEAHDSTASPFVQEECSICLEALYPKQDGTDNEPEPKQQPIAKYCCGHLFHEECIVAWCKSKKADKRCPQCTAGLRNFMHIRKLQREQEHNDNQQEQRSKKRRGLSQTWRFIRVRKGEGVGRGNDMYVYTSVLVKYYYKYRESI